MGGRERTKRGWRRRCPALPARERFFPSLCPRGGFEPASSHAPEQDPAAPDSSAKNEQDANMDTAEDAELPGEKFPATRLDELAVPDVNESSLNEITYAINEMYARHGADFKDKKVADQFSEFSWYKRRPGVTLTDAEVEFSDLEKQNLKVLQRCRDAKIAAARRK